MENLFPLLLPISLFSSPYGCLFDFTPIIITEVARMSAVLKLKYNNLLPLYFLISFNVGLIILDYLYLSEYQEFWFYNLGYVLILFFLGGYRRREFY